MNYKTCLSSIATVGLLLLITSCNLPNDLKTSFKDSFYYQLADYSSCFSYESSGDKLSTVGSTVSYKEFFPGQIHFSLPNTLNKRLYNHKFAIDQNKTIECVLKLANQYSSYGISTPLIMLCHGWKGTVTEDTWYGNSDESNRLIDYFCNAGFNVFDVNSTDGIERSNYPDFGCLELINSYYNAYDYICLNYNVSGLFSYAMSFGTFSCLNMVQLTPGIFKAVIITGPRTSYKKMWEVSESFRESIATKFYFDDTTGNTYETDKMNEFDLYQRISDGANLAINMPPSMWLFGDQELDGFTNECTLEILDNLSNSGFFVKRLMMNRYDHSDICYLRDVYLKEYSVSFLFDFM